MPCRRWSSLDVLQLATNKFECWFGQRRFSSSFAKNMGLALITKTANLAWSTITKSLSSLSVRMAMPYLLRSDRATAELIFAILAFPFSSSSSSLSSLVSLALFISFRTRAAMPEMPRVERLASPTSAMIFSATGRLGCYEDAVIEIFFRELLAFDVEPELALPGGKRFGISTSISGAAARDAHCDRAPGKEHFSDFQGFVKVVLF